MFREVESKINYAKLEEKILEFWEKKDIFRKSLELTKGGENFVFFEGPPTANGKPGIHHVMSRTVKDVVCRYKSMKGFHVNRKAGWDTHGLPVEIEVEKQLKINGKDQIEEYGVGEFNAMCRNSVFTYKNDWDELTKRIGYWLDLDDPYITFENNYIESVWWILKQLWDKDLIYEGFKILPYCPRCETPLSSHEVSQGYKNVKDPSIYIRVELQDEPATYFLVWTTTPWTLISNVALAVNPKVNYVKLKDLQSGEHYIMAEALISSMFKEDEYEIVERFSGNHLLGKRYKRIFDYISVDKDAFYVIEGDFVTTTDGTGIVHIAPAFGEDDNRAGRKYDLPVIRPVDEKGAFEKEVGDWAGMFVKDADPLIIDTLKKRRILVRKTKIEHSYPHCWRCQSPLLYYARESWYIKTSKFKEALLKNNAQINWYPKEVGEGRFGEWLKNNVDWSLSRDRYWGTPLNIWICGECGHKTSVGSIDEMLEKDISGIKRTRDDVDLHKPYVDDIVFKCEKCGGDMRRTPEVIDCWFDSGSMPIAQWHYPFENKEKFERSFPADFICEGIDQTRGWFYSLLAISTLLFDEPAYKNIVVNELILDKNGQKMSKTRGNAVVPQEMIEKYGADAIRWYLMTVSAPWIPKKFDPDGVAEVQRKFLNTLLNTYSFFVLYANVDKFDPTVEAVPFEKRPEIDRWILSKLYSVINQVERHFEEFNLTRAARVMANYLIDDVSNWYVRRNRRRFWKSGDSDDKIAAYQTLYEVLINVVKLIAPYAPFISEEIYQNLHKNSDCESVHHCHYPQLDDDRKARIDLALEERMSYAQQIVSAARALRNEAQIKVRQPLSELAVVIDGETQKKRIEAMSDLICEELNVKKITFADDVTKIMNLTAKPNFKTLGAKAGKLMGKLAAAVKEFSIEQIKSLQENGYENISVDGHEFKLEKEDVLIDAKAKEGFAAYSDNNLTLALNTVLSEELSAEGLAREFVNRIQNLRKEAGFEVTDRIYIQLDGLADKMEKAVNMEKDYIANETLADKISIEDVSADFKRDVIIEDKEITIGLIKTD